MTQGSSELLTFLIADIRGYTRFTQERGDEAAAKLTDRFAAIVRDQVTAFDGTVFELRGDEALCVFKSPRQCLRAAIALQRRFVEQTLAAPDLPMAVGIGVDAGEAVRGPDGYRGGALNLAARLCSHAGAGQILASPEVTHLARAVDGITYVVLDGVVLKGLAEPIRPVRVVPDGPDPADELAAARARAKRAAPTSTPSARRKPRGGRSVPSAAPALIGRAPELAAVRELLQVPENRLVTITGAPGVGKTRLAIAAAAQVAENFADGVVWVDLAPLREASRLMAEVAHALDIAERAADVGVDALADALAGQEILLVLDNCEHLLDAVPQIGELLTVVRQPRVLATSRERLRLTIEREYPLPPLQMPAGVDPTDLDKLRDNPAIALLLARAPDSIQLTPRTSQALSEICVRLDGLPLAIELAAARLRVFTPSELAFRLGHHAAPLTSTTRDVPFRHRDISTAIAWSHDLLPENERAVFRRASVFAATWTLTDMVAVTPTMNEYDVVAAVDSLLDKSLIRRADVAVDDSQEARFTMLFSVREFASQRLAEQDETDDVRRCHVRHFAEVALEWERTVGTHEEGVTFAWTEYARLDLIAALEFARERHDELAALQLATALGWYWYTRGSLADVAGVRETFARAAQRSDIDVDLLAAALVSSGVVLVGLGDHDAAERDLVRAVEMCTGRRDDRRLAVAHAFLGHALRGRGDHERAAEHYGAARTIWTTIDSDRGLAWSGHDLGVLAYESGDYPTAERYLRDALLGFRRLDYQWAVAVTACALANVLIAQGQARDAAVLLGESLVIHDAGADRRGIAQCLESLASLALLRNDPATAGRLLGAAEAWRAAGAAPRSQAERARLESVDEAITRGLGRGAADTERHAGRALPPVASVALAAAFAAAARDEPPTETDDTEELTARQRDVAALVAAGHTNRQIGRLLGISEKTAEVHLRNIMERLNTPSRAGVAAWAAARRLLPPQS